MGSKGNKVEKNYHFLWREVGEMKSNVVLENLILKASLFMIADWRLQIEVDALFTRRS